MWLEIGHVIVLYILHNLYRYSAWPCDSHEVIQYVILLEFVQIQSDRSPNMVHINQPLPIPEGLIARVGPYYAWMRYR